MREDPAPGIRILAIDDPGTRNALSANTYRRLTHEIAEAEEHPGLRVMIITGAGGVFTSGNDLNDFRDRPDATAALGLLHALACAETPVIAAVEGFAIGIGTTMLLHCDLAYAGCSAIFALPFTRLGLSPEGGSSLLLPQLAGAKRATEMLLLGERFSAHDAQSAGLLNTVVEDGTALATALHTAHKLTALPDESLRATKRLLTDKDAVRRAIDREAAIFARRLQSPEAQSAISAVLDRPHAAAPPANSS
jgi:enoyl-CoA hydratase/carnithine racemase